MASLQNGSNEVECGFFNRPKISVGLRHHGESVRIYGGVQAYFFHTVKEKSKVGQNNSET